MKQANYMQREKRTKKGNRQKKKKLILTTRTTQNQLDKIITGSKSTWIEFKKQNKMTYQVFPQIPIIVKPSTLMQNVTSRFNRI